MCKSNTSRRELTQILLVNSIKGLTLRNLDDSRQWNDNATTYKIFCVNYGKY